MKYLRVPARDPDHESLTSDSVYSIAIWWDDLVASIGKADGDEHYAAIKLTFKNGVLYYWNLDGQDLKVDDTVTNLYKAYLAGLVVS